jgi:hypothetical protein
VCVCLCVFVCVCVYACVCVHMQVLLSGAEGVLGSWDSHKAVPLSKLPTPGVCLVNFVFPRFSFSFIYYTRQACV